MEKQILHTQVCHDFKFISELMSLFFPHFLADICSLEEAVRRAHKNAALRDEGFSLLMSLLNYFSQLYFLQSANLLPIYIKSFLVAAMQYFYQQLLLILSFLFKMVIIGNFLKTGLLFAIENQLMCGLFLVPIFCFKIK